MTINEWDYYSFCEQFANSPQINHDAIQREFQPITSLVQQGMKESVFQKMEMGIFFAFTITPIIQLIKEHKKSIIVFDNELRNEAFKTALRAVQKCPVHHKNLTDNE